MGFEVQPYEPPEAGAQGAAEPAALEGVEAQADATPSDDGGNDDEPKRPRLTIVK
ncbi:hypothetical protein D3C71_2076210 [compost metagenome]